MLYCDWNNRDSLLVSKQTFKNDLHANIKAMQKFGVSKAAVKYFIPPYEWYNDSIAKWTNESGIELVNFSPGTKSTSDYTWPGLKNYRSSAEIYHSIIEREESDAHGLNGFILLIHVGTDPRRTDKFYYMLDALLKHLKLKGYSFNLLDEVVQ